MVDAVGPLIVDFASTSLGAEDREVLAHPLVAGIILFTRNYESPLQLASLCTELHRLRPRNPLLVTVDHEGGRVQRFRDGFTPLPPAAVHGRASDIAGARAHGQRLAAELLERGVDLSFAPVLDLDRGLGSVIGDRAFGPDPVGVTMLGQAWIDGMHSAGMAACIKHFPGHGGVAGDSHEELPVDTRPWHTIEAEDLVPFARVVETGVESVMMAHVAFPEVDPLPASLSHHWIADVLRGRLGFQGVVICDDLNMGGAAGFGDYPERARAAIAAGCDLLPVCNHRAGVIDILDSGGLRPARETVARVDSLRPKT